MRTITTILLIVAFCVISFVLKEVRTFYDGTSNGQHSWSPEAVGFVRKISEPIDITFYATQSEPSMPYDLRQYKKYVERMLKELANQNPDKIKVEYLDPTPGSAAEESAKFNQITPLHYTQNTSCYLGLTFECGAKRKSIPFLSPDREGLLKYDILYALDEVSLKQKVKVSLVSSLPVMGGEEDSSGQRLPQWLIIDELKRFCEIRNDSHSLSEIETDPPELLLVIHPQDKDGSLEAVLESYLANGGKLVLLVDPFCVATTFLWGDRPKPELASSDLPEFFKNRGIKFDPGKVIVDMDHKSSINRGFGQEVMHSILDLSAEAFLEESQITANLTNSGFVFAGNLDISQTSDPDSIAALIGSSQNSSTVASEKFASLSREDNMALLNSFSSDQKQKVLAVAVGNGEEKGAEKIPQIVVFSDVDFVFDAFAATAERISAKEVSINPINSNFALLTNTVDTLLKRKALLGARSQGGMSYRLKNLEKKKVAIQNRYQSQKAQLETSIVEMEAERKKASELLTDENTQGYFSVKEKIIKFDEVIEANKTKISLLDLEIKKEESNLLRKIQWFNILTVPVIVILSGLIYISRRHRISQKSYS